MSKKLSFLRITHEFFESIYASKTDPATTEWSHAEVVMALALAEHSYTDGDRSSTLAAKIMETLDPADRLSIVEEYDVPGGVTNKIGTDLEWPDAKSTRDFASVTSENIADMKTRRISSLRHKINVAVRKIVVSGERMAMTYMMQTIESLRYLDAEAPDDELFPHIASYMTIADKPDMTSAAQEMLARSRAWSTANAALETLRVGQSSKIGSATTASEIETLYQEGVEQADLIVQTVVDQEAAV